MRTRAGLWDEWKQIQNWCFKSGQATVPACAHQIQVWDGQGRWAYQSVALTAMYEIQGLGWLSQVTAPISTCESQGCGWAVKLLYLLLHMRARAALEGMEGLPRFLCQLACMRTIYLGGLCRGSRQGSDT